MPGRPGALLVRDVSAAEVGAAAFAARVELHELSPRDVDLEDIFLELTSGHADRTAGGGRPREPPAPPGPGAGAPQQPGGAQ